MSVGRICIRTVDTADAQEPVWDVAERMRQRSVGTLVVVNRQQEPFGVVTDRDLVERVLAARRDPGATLIGRVMTADPKTVSEETSIESALSLMRSGKFRRLPVVDSQGHLTGLLSMDDVLLLLTKEFTQIGKLIEQETPSGVATESGC